MKKQVIIKDNALIDASFNLSLTEQRLMLLAIVSATDQVPLTPATPVEVSAKSYMNQFPVGDSSAYEALSTACRTLKRREFSYKDRYKGEHAISTANWVNKVTYVKSKGMVVLYLSEEVISMISRLEREFTKYYIEQVSEFKSKYSIRLYEILIKWLSVGKSNKFTVEDLRAKLGVEPTEYKTMSLFKTNVLDKATEEINSKTDIKIEYEQYRTGRSISHFSFKIINKNPIPLSKPYSEYQFDMTDKQIFMFSQKLASDSIFGSIYAEQGELLEDFNTRISKNLQLKTNRMAYAEHLIRLGYREN